jgi:hypothetical protein
MARCIAMLEVSLGLDYYSGRASFIGLMLENATQQFPRYSCRIARIETP